MASKTSQKVERSACGKIILCGEHAVVYGRPAIALPLLQLRTRARVEGGDLAFHISAPDIRAEFDLKTDPTRPLAHLARLTFEFLQLPIARATLTVVSDIPASSHLGSSASVAVACARAIAAYYGHELAAADASRLAFEAEQIYHGSPSGIDNTVIAYEQPVWFVRRSVPTQRTTRFQQEPAANTEESGPQGAVIPYLQPPSLVIGDTGIATPTRVPVGDVRAGWLSEPARYERIFDGIAEVVLAARAALESAEWPALGALMNTNHMLLQQLGVSCAELDRLCDAARLAGAVGAKLSGGGRGGNMIALAGAPEQANRIRQALRDAGALRVI